MKRIVVCVMLVLTFAGITACKGGKKGAQAVDREPEVIVVAAAASLENAYRELIPGFQERFPWVTVRGVYDSSGRLQTQIEQGLEADVFMSAAAKQMDALAGQSLVLVETVRPLLENKVVLIRPAGAKSEAEGFETAHRVKMIALGDPASVPAGQYAEEIFRSLGIWEDVAAKASFGSNVTEVLGWVSAASADLGVVYATDAASTGDVEVIALAPEGSLKTRVLYPAGVVAASKHPEAAVLFLDYLGSPEGIAVFERYGFSKAD